MEPESKVDVYKRLTLDLVCSTGWWMDFDDIAADFEASDGEVDGNALRGALEELVAEGKILRDGPIGDYDYRIAPPQEGESLAEKLKRLEAENERLRAEQAADRAAVRALVEALCPSCAALARGALPNG